MVLILAEVVLECAFISLDVDAGRGQREWKTADSLHEFFCGGI